MDRTITQRQCLSTQRKGLLVSILGTCTTRFSVCARLTSGPRGDCLAQLEEGAAATVTVAVHG